MRTDNKVFLQRHLPAGYVQTLVLRRVLSTFSGARNIIRTSSISYNSFHPRISIRQSHEHIKGNKHTGFQYITNPSRIAHTIAMPLVRASSVIWLKRPHHCSMISPATTNSFRFAVCPFVRKELESVPVAFRWAISDINSDQSTAVGASSQSFTLQSGWLGTCSRALCEKIPISKESDCQN